MQFAKVKRSGREVALVLDDQDGPDLKLLDGGELVIIGTRDGVIVRQVMPWQKESLIRARRSIKEHRDTLENLGDG